MGVTKLEADFRIVTPLFMGGADPTVPVLHVPGIKGALRFWWRALAYGRLGGDLNAIKDEEGQIFGSTKHGQSRVIIELNERPKTEMDSLKGLSPGLRYLSYGLTDQKRNYLKTPFDATIRITIRPKVKDKDSLDDIKIVENIASALRTMGLFGGLGSRTRRGFGSFNLMELKYDGKLHSCLPSDLGELKNEIRNFFSEIKHQEGLPEYTAFSSGTSVYIFDGYRDPLELLDSVGRLIQQYRVGIRGSPSKFKLDTMLAKKALFSVVGNHPRRVFFGLPHNYHFPKLGALDVKPKSRDKHDRRASPLLIHIQEMKDGDYAAIAALIPAKFLPDNDMIQIKRQKEDNENDRSIIESLVPVYPNDEAGFKVISDFFDSNWEKVIL